MANLVKIDKRCSLDNAVTMFVKEMILGQMLFDFGSRREQKV
uniref:Uncharacterized protein n=1 Tax=Arundo donax TaxID=35708 RepID=A0A0A8YLE9_ARUDO